MDLWQFRENGAEGRDPMRSSKKWRLENQFFGRPRIFIDNVRIGALEYERGKWHMANGK